MGEAVGQVYVAENFPAASKAFTLQMVHDIEAAMGTELETQTWMSDPTKQTAEAKLHIGRRQDRLSRSLARLFDA